MPRVRGGEVTGSEWHHRRRVLNTRRTRKSTRPNGVARNVASLPQAIRDLRMRSGQWLLFVTEPQSCVRIVQFFASCRRHSHPFGSLVDDCQPDMLDAALSSIGRSIPSGERAYRDYLRRGIGIQPSLRIQDEPSISIVRFRETRTGPRPSPLGSWPLIRLISECRTADSVSSFA